MEVVRGDDEPVVAALARHLRTVADHAGPCETLTVVVPPSWGPRHHGRVSRAASTAGLPPPLIINEAAAIAWRCFASAGPDDTVMVCVLGEDNSHATVVQRSTDGWTRVATQPIPDATGDHMDQTLATAVGIGDDLDNDLRTQIAGARPRLAADQPTAIVAAGQPFPLKPSDFANAAQTARNAAVTAVLDTLDTAAVDPHQLHGTVSAGDLADTISLPEALSKDLGAPVTAAADGRLTAAYGALTARAPVLPKTPGPVRRRWGFRAAYLVSPLVAAIAAGLLQWQIFDSVQFLLGSEVGRIAADYEKLPFIFDTAAFACVGWCLLAAALGLARNLAAAIHTTPDEGRANVRQAGQTYAFAAIVGLALASMQGLLAQALIGGPDEYAPPYLAASLAGAAVPALVAITVGLAAPWLTAQPAWTERLHHPTAAVVCAVTGILAANAQSTGRPIPGVPAIITEIVGITGGGLLGVGIAMTLVTMRSARLILGALLGAASMIIVGFSNLHSTIIIYLIVVAVWWIRRGTRILLDSLPPNWWHRLALTTQDGHQT
ncbi:hypothetical protein F4553_005341 [Allocatelliglobosispora scoriae]|uniref:Uncharacterized protein n=1 Tax=Allocatelliglobosispora scoriae TaxID=643052 RepID=A0A841BYT0_9ACTN|nr:hypothetical protein [Allocatelliglobosispora scoriae]MBB5871962.1 hypothetical protein [Allocatelliglobosispora scoriae]